MKAQRFNVGNRIRDVKERAKRFMLTRVFKPPEIKDEGDAWLLMDETTGRLRGIRYITEEGIGDKGFGLGAPLGMLAGVSIVPAIGVFTAPIVAYGLIKAKNGENYWQKAEYYMDKIAGYYIKAGGAIAGLSVVAAITFPSSLTASLFNTVIHYGPKLVLGGIIGYGLGAIVGEQVEKIVWKAKWVVGVMKAKSAIIALEEAANNGTVAEDWSRHLIARIKHNIERKPEMVGWESKASKCTWKDI